MKPTVLEALEALEVEPPPRVPGHILCLGHDESTPSLWVSESRWWAFCCGLGGDAYDLVRFVTGATWPQAVRFLDGVLDGLPDRPDVVREPRELLDLGETLMNEATTATTALVEARKFVDERWPHLGLPWLQQRGVRVSRYNLLIPHRDHELVVRGIKTRSFTGGQRGKKSSYPGSCFTTRLYRVQDKPKAQYALITEGESDCWTLSRHFEHTPKVAVFALPSGANAWHADWEAELRGKHVWLYIDNDATGRAAAERLQERLGLTEDQAGPKFPEEYKDVTEAYLAGWRPLVFA